MTTTTKATHTPGPWDITATGGDIVTPGSTDILIGTRQIWIARLFHPQSHVLGTTSLAPQPEEAIGNAHLIAAAPALLEACETTLDEWAAAIHDEGGEDFLTKLRRAIAAARGEA